MFEVLKVPRILESRFSGLPLGGPERTLKKCQDSENAQNPGI
jgi:hypothetical protein